MTSPSTTRSISSAQNAHVKRWVALQEARGIERFRQCLVPGKKVVRETLVQHPAQGLELLHRAGTPVPFSVPAHVTTYALSTPLFEKIDLFGTGAPILVCQVPPFPAADFEARPRGLEILCPLGDPANVGAVIRTAAAMGVERVILLKESAHPFHPKAIRAASGTTFTVSLAQGPSIRDLPEAVTWVTLDAQGESLPAYRWPKDVRLLIGEEGLGLPPRSSGTRLAVPMTDSVESLNAVVAAGMALYAYRVQYPWHPPKTGPDFGRQGRGQSSSPP